MQAKISSRAHRISVRFLEIFKRFSFVLWNTQVTWRIKLIAIEKAVNTAYEVICNNIESVVGENSPTLLKREDFVNLVPKFESTLEIGPFANPLLRGEQVSYCDVLSQQELQERAREVGAEPATVPFIHYKLGSEFLDEIPVQFSNVISSHNIEHQPDLINHLHQVERRLKPGGKFFLLIPDKRYCFDRALPVSTLADVLLAHEEKRKFHSLKSVIEHRCLTTHNDSPRHWETRDLPHEVIPNAQQLQAAVQEWREKKNSYVDVHAWYFTSESFALIIQKLGEMGLTRFKLVQNEPTRYGSNEFWCVLELDTQELPH